MTFASFCAFFRFDPEHKLLAYCVVVLAYVYLAYDPYKRYVVLTDPLALAMLALGLLMVMADPVALLAHQISAYQRRTGHLPWLKAEQTIYGYLTALSLYAIIAYYPQEGFFDVLHPLAVSVLASIGWLTHYGYFQRMIGSLQRHVASSFSYLLLHRQQLLSVYVSFFICSIAARFYLEVIRSASPFTPQAIGSDAMVSLLAACVVMLCGGRLSIPRHLFGLVWCYLLAINIDFIGNNDSNITFSMLSAGAQKVFLLGSAFSNCVLIKCTVLYVVFVICDFALTKPSVWTGNTRQSRRLALASLLPCLLVSQPLDHKLLEWQQLHWLASNANLLTEMMAGEQQDRSRLNEEEYQAIYHLDMNGRPQIIAPPSSKPFNVLLIITEGVSQEHLRLGWMPLMNKRREEGIYYSNFVTFNRVTFNGMYTTLCGDMPRLNFIEPWLGQVEHPKDFSGKDSAVNTENLLRKCLPYYLRKQGYRTTYVQAAPIGYSDKDIFMPLIGFEYIVDDQKLPVPQPTNSTWGPVDSALFKSVEELWKKEPADVPRFYAVMTAGTHHPYTLSPDCTVAETGKPDEENSYRCLDEALDRFITYLHESQIAKDTLVIITSDEASVWVDRRPYPSGALTNNHGFALVFTPDQRKGTNTGFFNQADLMPSILDYVGHPLSENNHDYGRSIFREYDAPRTLYFGNYFQSAIYMAEKDKLIMCKVNRPICLKYHFPPDQLFDAEFTEDYPSVTEITHLRAAANSIGDHLVMPDTSSPMPFAP